MRNDIGKDIASTLPVRTFATPPKGARVAFHAGTDQFWRGERYGTITSFTGLRECRDKYGQPAQYLARLVRVRGDSGRKYTCHPAHIEEYPQ